MDTSCLGYTSTVSEIEHNHSFYRIEDHICKYNKHSHTLSSNWVVIAALNFT